jgi:hypothetical protein
MSDLIGEARAVAEQLRATVRDDELPGLLDRLCDALVECGYDLSGQFAALLVLSEDWDVLRPAPYERAGREIVREGHKTDPRWKLVHRTVGPWREVDDV